MHNAPKCEHPIAANDPDRRRAIRRQTRHRGYVVHGRAHTIVEVSLKDISPGGAMIDVDTPLALSEDVMLIDPQTQTLYQCAVSHKHPQTYGLRFVNKHPLNQLPPEMRYLADLWMHMGRSAFAPRRN